jgi:hypothetical protein
VESALRLESGATPGAPGALSQFARLAVPFTTGEQGEFAARDLPAVLVSVSGERGPGAATAAGPQRLGAVGRAVLRSITAIDARREPPARPRAEIHAGRNVVPGWAVRLLSAALILPVLLAGVDALARVRRRRHPVGMWARWVIAGALPFAGALAFAYLLRLTGLMPTPPPAPAPADAVPVDAAALAVLAAVTLALVVGWLAVRPLVLRLWGVRGDPGSPGAAAALVVVLALTGTAVWAFNPFAAMLLVLPLHACLLVTAPEVRIRPGAAVATLALTLLPPALVALYYAIALGYGPLDLVWNALLNAVGGHLGLLGALAWCLLFGCLASALAVIRARRGYGPPEEPDGKPAIRGPLTYAGPGSLGGTESALRR